MTSRIEGEWSRVSSRQNQGHSNKKWVTGKMEYDDLEKFNLESPMS